MDDKKGMSPISFPSSYLTACRTYLSVKLIATLTKNIKI